MREHVKWFQRTYVWKYKKLLQYYRFQIYDSNKLPHNAELKSFRYNGVERSSKNK